MRHRLFILLLTLCCLGARFHCALGDFGMGDSCGGCHQHESTSHEEDCAGGCPDLESDSTSMARKLANANEVPLLVNAWASGALHTLLLGTNPAVAPVIPTVPPPDEPGTALTEALASHSISPRGPPSRA